ncbi:MAG: efflux RND transporter periplasmic adaptor subunit, partial [Planctomycetes bacterium]|nr:efflux RND transporter periplasmic adaptor subunit [Planctomycetota bacterium]
MPRLVPFLAAGLLLAAGCGQSPPTSQTAEVPPASVATAVAESRQHASMELIPGTVRAARAATIMARVQGAVKRIEADPGRPLATGDLLLELDALEIAARRDQAKATAARAAADYERARMLFDKQATTKAEYDAAQARAAEGAAAAAEAEVLVGYTRISAPFAGVVVRKHVEVGDLVSPGRAVVDIEDPATLRLEVEVPESLAARVVLGATLQVQVAAAGLDLAAPVVEITPAADPVSRSVLVKLALPADA